VCRYRFEQGVHERHIDHRSLVEDEQVALKRVLLVTSEAAVFWADL
jgi:hypothetical protein